MKYGNATLGQVEAVWNILGGEEGVARVLSRKVEVILKLIVESLTRILSSLTIGKTSGQRTIAKATKLFGYIDPDFKNWGTDVESEAHGETSVEVRELTQDATFIQMFGDTGRPMDDMVLTQDQIIEFVEKHREHLRTDGYATFFLFKAKNEVFVASVRRAGGGDLGVDVGRFSGGYVWYSGRRHRVVVRN